MAYKRAIAAGLLCMLMAVFFLTFVQEAQAKPFDGNPDGPKTGLGEVFKSRAATGVGPNKTQFWVTIGATVIALAVIKYV